MPARPRKPLAKPPVTPGGQIVGELIRRYRRLRGLTQAQLATSANVTKAYISRLESGKVGAPGKAVLERIANVLDIPLKELASPLGWYEDEGSADTWDVVRQKVVADARLSDEQKRGILIVLKEFFPAK